MSRVSTRQEVESSDYLPDFGSEKILDYRNLKLTLVAQPIVAVGDREFKDVVEAEAFMQELIVIRVHPTSDINAPPLVPAGCNGEVVWLPRGQPVNIPRKFIESLARYETNYATQRAQDPNADDGMVQRTRANQPYPFTVIHDPHPKGRAWLDRTMRGG